MSNILISGGSGLIGSSLSKKLAASGYDVIILSRSRSNAPAIRNISYAFWDPSKKILDEEAVRKADILVHLAGTGIADKRWTPNRKKELADSRVQSANLLVDAIRKNSKIHTVISASAIGYYGSDPVVPNPHPFREIDKPSKDFLGNLAHSWESAVMPVQEMGKRLVIFRTGIVLSAEGGAYPELTKTLPFGIASILGNGRQMISWIHINDLVNFYIHAINHEKFNGIYNAVSPFPVSNQDMILKVARHRNKFYVPLHIPAIALKVALGEMAVEVLKSTTVSAGKLLDHGGKFDFPDIEMAVNDIEANNSKVKIQKSKFSSDRTH